MKDRTEVHFWVDMSNLKFQVNSLPGTGTKIWREFFYSATLFSNQFFLQCFDSVPVRSDFFDFFMRKS